jgi:hypothetical protein
MINAFLLIVDSTGTWERIVRAHRGLISILLTFLLPLLLVTCAIEGYGLMHWGKHQVTMVRPRTFTVGEAVVFESGQLLTSLVMVFIGAGVLKSMGGTFHTRNTYKEAFTVVAYALSPFFLLRLLDAFTPVSPWMSWAIGIFLTLAALYHGVRRPDLILGATAGLLSAEFRSTEGRLFPGLGKNFSQHFNYSHSTAFSCFFVVLVHTL